MDEKIVWTRGHFILALLTFVLTSGIVFISNETRQARFEATTENRLTNIERDQLEDRGYKRAMNEKLDNVRFDQGLLKQQQSSLNFKIFGAGIDPNIYRDRLSQR